MPREPTATDGGSAAESASPERPLVVLERDVVVRTDADARALRGVDVIRGELRIERSTLTELADLASLQAVGALVIRENAALTSLGGLERLARVDHDVAVEENPVLVAVSLPALASAGGVLRLGSDQTALVDPNTHALLSVAPELSNEKLASASFPALTRVRALAVIRNPALATLAFPELLRIDNDVDVSFCPALTELSSAFPKLETIGGTLTLGREPGYVKWVDGAAAESVPPFGNTRLASAIFPALRHVRVVDARVPTLSFPRLEDAEDIRGTIKALDLGGVRTLGSSIVLTGAAVLRAPSLQRVAGGIALMGGDLSTLALPSLTRVEGGLSLMDTELRNLEGLEALAFAESITLTRNWQLESLAGLGALGAVGSWIEVVSNGRLTDLTLPSLTRADIIMLRANGALTSVSLPKLELVRSNLSVDRCLALTSLRAPALVHAGSFSVSSRGSRISTLELGLTELPDGLSLEDGPTSLDAFAALTQLGSLYIRTRNMPKTDLDAFVARLAARGVTPVDVDVRYSPNPH